MNKTVRIEEQNIETSKCLRAWYVYKMTRINNKVYAYSHTDKLTFVFDTVLSAKNLIEQFKKGQNNG